MMYGTMSLIQKLKPRPGKTAVINSPKNILAELKELKPAASIPAGVKESFDFVLLFATKSNELESAWKRIVPALKEDGIFWVAYPKKSSGIPSDLGGMSGGFTVHAGSPWQPVAAASIDDTWTGVRFKFAPNLESERQERGSEDICDADGMTIVDRTNRVVHAPKDLASVLSKHPEAKAFFDGLSFTNKKEYALCIIDAKKAETRAKRVNTALEKMVSGKKNPSEK